MHFVHACNAIKRRSGVRGAERALCGSELSPNLAPQTTTVLVLDHSLMRSLCLSPLYVSLMLSPSTFNNKTTPAFKRNCTPTDAHSVSELQVNMTVTSADSQKRCGTNLFISRQNTYQNSDSD